MILVSIKQKDIAILEEIFAYLTSDGWATPQWLVYLKEQAT